MSTAGLGDAKPLIARRAPAAAAAAAATELAICFPTLIIFALRCYSPLGLCNTFD